VAVWLCLYPGTLSASAQVSLKCNCQQPATASNSNRQCQQQQQQQPASPFTATTATAAAATATLPLPLGTCQLPVSILVVCGYPAAGLPSPRPFACCFGFRVSPVSAAWHQGTQMRLCWYPDFSLHPDLGPGGQGQGEGQRAEDRTGRCLCL